MSGRIPRRRLEAIGPGVADATAAVPGSPGAPAELRLARQAHVCGAKLSEIGEQMGREAQLEAVDCVKRSTRSGGAGFLRH